MHPLVEKFVRGVFNRRPAFSRNTVTWDANIVLTFLKKWSPAANLSLPQLTLSGAFMPVSVGPEGSGPMVIGSTQHYLVKDRHSMHV